MANNTFYRIAVIFLIYLIINIFLNGCGCTQYWRIKGLESINAYKYDREEGFSYLDTIRTPFTLFAYFDLESELALHEFSSFSQALAMSCVDIVVNPVNEDHVLIYTDREFIYDTTQINPGTYLQELDGIDYLMHIEGIQFRFSEEFISKTIFDTSAYKFTVEFATNDTIPEKFSGDISLHWRIP
jgi:hypothetical protein